MLKQLLEYLIVRLRLRRRYLGRFNFARRMEWQKVLASLHPSSRETVCDVGCGTGTYTHMMARKVCKVYGTDLSLNSLSLAMGPERPSNCFFECANAEHLPFRDCAFDSVFSICTFEHIKNDTRALQEVERVLKPGGAVVLTLDSFSYASGISGPERERILKERSVHRLYRLPQSEAWINSCGLRVEKSHYLVRSPLSDWFYRLGSRLGYARSLIFVMLFPILYPVAVVSDKIAGSKEGGYVLAITARKPMDSCARETQE